MMHLWSLPLMIMIGGFHLILRLFCKVVLHTITKAFEGTLYLSNTQHAQVVLHFLKSMDYLADATLRSQRKALGILMLVVDYNLFPPQSTPSC